MESLYRNCKSLGLYHKFKDVEMQRKPEQDGDEGKYMELIWEVHAMGRFKDDK